MLSLYLSISLLWRPDFVQADPVLSHCPVSSAGRSSVVGLIHHWVHLSITTLDTQQIRVD